MTAIADIHAREILDSRGNPTVEVEVTLDGGTIGRAAVPSGASTGAHEAVEKRDGGQRFGGRGVLQAVEAVNGEIFDALSGFDAADQLALDRVLIELDGTPNKARLGANAILGVSLAAAKAAAADLAQPLYRYVGGVFARTLAGADDEHHQWRRACRQPDRHPGIHDHAGRCALPRPRRFASAPRFSTPCAKSSPMPATTPMSATRAGLPRTSLRPMPRWGSSCRRSKPPATIRATTWSWRSTRPRANSTATALIACEGKTLDSAALIAYWRDLVERYPIVSIEDGMAEDDWDGWVLLTRELGGRIQLVGDDVFVTNPERLRDGIARGAANALLVKVNQIGTLSETLDAVEIAQRAGWGTVFSHRSGETEDTTIADLAVATNCGQIKTGSLSRSDRLAKYNQLIRIEEQLGGGAVYGGRSVLARSASAPRRG